MIKTVANSPVTVTPSKPPTPADVVATIDTVDRLVASSNDLWLKQCQAELHSAQRITQAGIATAGLGGLTAAGALVGGLTHVVAAPYGIGLGIAGVIAACAGAKLIDSGLKLGIQATLGAAGALLQREGLKVSTEELKDEVQQLQPGTAPQSQPLPPPFDPAKVGQP